MEDEIADIRSYLNMLRFSLERFESVQKERVRRYDRKPNRAQKNLVSGKK